MAIKNALATIYIWIRFEQAITFVVIAAIHILDKVVCKLLLQKQHSSSVVSSLSPPCIFFIFTLSIPTLYLLPPMHHHYSGNSCNLLQCYTFYGRGWISLIAIPHKNFLDLFFDYSQQILIFSSLIACSELNIPSLFVLHRTPSHKLYCEFHSKFHIMEDLHLAVKLCIGQPSIAFFSILHIHIVISHHYISLIVCEPFYDCVQI